MPAGQQTVAARRLGYEVAMRGVRVADGGDLTVDFELRASATRLAALLTTATGEQRRLEVGSAVATLQADSIVRTAAVTSLADLLTARVPAVQVLPTGGMSGSSPRTRIRGFNSLSLPNAPLVMVDGVRVESSETSHAGLGWSAGHFDDYSIGEIESVQIVKGASAATLYGTDAANGIIFITTKRGQPGAPRWTVVGERGLITQPSPFHTNYYAFGHRSTGAPVRCLNPARAAGTCALDSLSRFNAMRDPLRSPVGYGSREGLGAQVVGGVQLFRYFLGGKYDHEVGYLRLPSAEIQRVSEQRGGAAVPEEQIRPNYVTKTAIRANATTEVGRHADVTVSTGLVLRRSQIPSSNVFENAAFGPGYRDALDGWSVARPGESFAVRALEDVSHFTGSLAGNWRPLPWLTARGTLGIDLVGNRYDALVRRGEGPPGLSAEGRRDNTTTNVRVSTGTISASALFALCESLSSRSSIGAQYTRRGERVTTLMGQGLPPGSETIAGARSVTAAEGTDESVIAGVYAEQTFGFRDRVFMTGAVRADGATTFGKNFKTAVYPKASISWLVSDESFFLARDLVSSLRLRVAYGAAGVQPSSVAALTGLNVITVVAGGVAQTGAVIGALGNTNLRPERSAELETGFDAELLQGRLRLEGTYYRKQTEDAIVDRPLPASLGVQALTRQENVGVVRNEGLEALLTARVMDRGGVTFDLSVAASANRNRLARLAPGVRSPDATFVRYQQGYPIFGYWHRPVATWADANGDAVITGSEVVVGDSVAFLGSGNPTRVFTAMPSVSVFGGRLRISSTFDHRGGWVQSNDTEANKCSVYQSCRAANDPTAPLADQARYAALDRTRAGYVRDATYTRWREAAVAVDVPEEYLRRLRARTAMITLGARNLRLWTRYDGLDPEVSAGPGGRSNAGTVWDLGYDNPTSLPSRYWIARVSLGL